MAGADKNTRRIDPGRSSHQPAKPVSETASGEETVKKSQAEQDAEWGFEASRGGMAIEAKMGAVIAVILLCAFAFLVYTKYERKQNSLVASNTADDLLSEAQPSETENELIATQADSFSEFYPGETATTTEEPFASDESSVADLSELEPTSMPEQLGAPADQIQTTRQTENANAFTRIQELAGRFDSEPADSEPIDTFQPSTSDMQPLEAATFPAQESVAVVEDSSADSSEFSAGQFATAETSSDDRVAPNETLNGDPFGGSLSNTPPLETEVAISDSAVPDATMSDATANSQQPAIASKDETGAEVNENSNAEISPLELLAQNNTNAAAPTEFPAFNDEGFAQASERPHPELEAFAETPVPDPGTGPAIDEPAEKAAAPADLFAGLESEHSDSEQKAPPVDHFAGMFDAAPAESDASEDVQSRNEAADAVPDSFVASQQSSNANAEASPTAALDPVPLLDNAEDRRTVPKSDPTLVAMVDPSENGNPVFEGFDESSAGTSQKTAKPKGASKPEPFPEVAAPRPVPQVAQRFPQFSDLTIDTEDNVPLPSDPAPQRSTFPLTLPSPSQSQSTATAKTQPRKAASPNYGVAHFVQGSGVQQVAAQEVPTQICTVKDNDTYWTISKRYYGTVRYFSALALFNQHRIRDPKKLRPGMKVLLPPAEVLEQKYPEFFPELQRKPADLTASPTGFFVTSDGAPAYRIGKNETLSGISLRHLGRASRWMEIYRLNRQVLKNPNSLKPGTVIRLPDDAASVQMAP